MAKLFVCLINYVPRYEDVWESGRIALPFLISALDGGEWSASRSRRFTPREWVTATHSIRYWVGTRAGSVEKNILLLPGIEP
jgi:hypothetical protein